MAKKIIMDSDWDKELAAAVKRGKKIDAELKKANAKKKTVKKAAAKPKKKK